MRSLSVKVKLAVWYVLLMALMAALLLAFLLAVSGSVTTQTALEQLDRTVRDNLSQVSLDAGGALAVGEDFRFYRDGVYTQVYSQAGALLAGQSPVSLTGEEFQNGLTRPVQAGGQEYYVLDFWVPSGWEGGVWVRGLMEVPEHPRAIANLLRIAVVAMPLFILLAALGGYLIARRAFRPLEELTATASAISQAADLSRRVEEPPGDNEFARLARTFNGMFQRLEQAFEAEAQFTADASHELRTPVAVIKSACEYAEKYGDSPEEQRETIAMIHRQADRMSALIGQLLSITRLDQGTEAVRLEGLDLTALVRNVCAEQPYPGDRLLVEAEEGLTVRGDGALLTRLLQNLIDNGFKYGRPGGRVWVELRRGEGEALLRVRDDGIGIAKEDQEKVWQRFYQADPSRTGASGAGLGLSMVRRIAQLHGGEMELESVPGLGSAFTLRLPLDPGPRSG